MRVNPRHLCNWGIKLNNEQASNRLTPSLRRRNLALLGGVCALAIALASGSSSAKAMNQHKAPVKEAEHASKEPFGDIPKGPVEIVVSIDQQKLHVYSDGQHIADTSVATGVPSLPTPLGIFDVIQKQVFHRSNIYSGAPMPFMQRITWSGVALHEGENIGHRASHGCIRMPHDFAVRLYQLTKLGARVIVADAELKPSEIADPHLFVHKVAPPPTPPALPVAAQHTEQAAAVAPRPVTNMVAEHLVSENLRGTDANPTLVVATSSEVVPLPSAKPAAAVTSAVEKKTPISIFVSRKTQKIYVRQNFAPLFDAAIKVDNPEQPLGSHVFTALSYLADGSTFRWDVVSLPGVPPKARQIEVKDRYGRVMRREQVVEKQSGPLPSPQTPAEALARLEIPQDVVDRISEMMVPGSSLIVSDQGLGEETGEGTDFIVVSR
jgi:lipoprotein-anchoring transpeptidase ErfK/SrfK